MQAQAKATCRSMHFAIAIALFFVVQFDPKHRRNPMDMRWPYCIRYFPQYADTKYCSLFHVCQSFLFWHLLSRSHLLPVSQYLFSVLCVSAIPFCPSPNHRSYCSFSILYRFFVAFQNRSFMCNATDVSFFTLFLSLSPSHSLGFVLSSFRQSMIAWL